MIFLFLFLSNWLIYVIEVWDRKSAIIRVHLVGHNSYKRKIRLISEKWSNGECDTLEQRAEEEDKLSILLFIVTFSQLQLESSHRSKGNIVVFVDRVRQREIENDNGFNPNNRNKELIQCVRDEPSRRSGKVIIYCFLELVFWITVLIEICMLRILKGLTNVQMKVFCFRGSTSRVSRPRRRGFEVENEF